MKNTTVAQPMDHKVPEIKNNGPQCPELEKVQKIIELYIDGVRNHKVVSLQEAFHPQSSFFGNNGNTLFISPIQGLFDHAASTPSPASTGEPINFFITSIQINGKAANVEMAMDGYQGSDYMDFFQLLKIEDRWWIVSKTFHANPHNQ